jgi:hypothetical protein
VLHKKESESVEAVDKIKDELTKENNRLRIELRSLDEQYKQKLERLQSQNQNDVQKLIDDLNTENEVN